MSPEKLNEICDAVDAVMTLGEINRKSVVREVRYLAGQIASRYEQAAQGRQLSHVDIIQIHALESEAEQLNARLDTWATQRQSAMDALELAVGVNLRRTVTPELQVLIQALAKVKRPQPDGSVLGISLRYIALATGLSEGTVSKLRSGNYPLSSFPATIKVGRRGARR